VRKKFKMHDFVSGGCVAIKDKERFLNDWFGTTGNPCSVCGEDKPKCPYYTKLEKIALGRRTSAPVDDDCVE
jgi:hypothetical protein